MVAAPLPPFVWYLRMADSRVGYAVGGRQTDRVFRLYRTADGAQSWTDVTPNGGTAHPVGPPTTVGRTVVFYPTMLRGAVVIERSADGGRTWRASAPIRDGSVAGPGPVLPLDTRHLYLPIGEGAAAGSSAQSLWRSDDGGRTWRFVSRTQTTGPPGRALPFGCDKTGVGFATLLRGWAGGACAGGPAFLYRTDDGGRTWRPLRLAGLDRCSCDVVPPRFFGARGVLSVDGFPDAGPTRALDRLYWTGDAGAHWRVSFVPAGRIGPRSVVDGTTAWVTGTQRGSVAKRFDRLFVTTDAGLHWRALRLPFDAAGYQLDAVSATVAYAYGGVGMRTSLLRTSDGGRSWRRMP